MPKKLKSRKSKKQVNTSESNICPDLRGHSCSKYPVNSRPLNNPSKSSNSRNCDSLKSNSICNYRENLNLTRNQNNSSCIIYTFGDVMGNVSSAIHRNGRVKTWKKDPKLNSQNFNSITEKVDAFTILEVPHSSHIKMNNSNDSNNNFENLNATNTIENVINSEQIALQVVSLARDSIDYTAQSKPLLELGHSLESGQNIDDNENNERQVSETEELSSQPSQNSNSTKSDKSEENQKNCKDYSKHKGSRLKNKQMKEIVPIEVNNNFIFKKGILKKEDLENEATFFLAAGYDSNGDVELPLQISDDPDSLFDSNVAINSVQNVTLKNGAATAYMFGSKRNKKNVRFNDNVVIIYYTSAECQQQAIRNGTFITSVVEPLKAALQQQQRNRELRNKHSYTHTVFPTTVRCGKS